MCGAPRGQHWLVASSAEPHGLENTRPACVRRWILFFEFDSLSFWHGALFCIFTCKTWVFWRWMAGTSVFPLREPSCLGVDFLVRAVLET